MMTMPTPTQPDAIDWAVFNAVLQLQQRCAQILDSDDLAPWAELFLEAGQYQLQSRENAAAGWPLCVMDLSSQAMLKDRIFACQETLYHAPYYQTHIVSAPHITTTAKPTIYAAQSSFLVMRTQRDTLPQTLATGWYYDEIVWDKATPELAAKFVRRRAVFDNDLLPNSVIKPI